MPTKPSATVGSAAALTVPNGHDKSVPRTVHLTSNEDFALRRAFETGQLPGTIDDFCGQAVHELLERYEAGLLAADPEFQLAMYHAKRERETVHLAHNIEQFDDTLHQAKLHIAFYARVRDKAAMAKYIGDAWQDADAIMIPLWRGVATEMFRDSVYARTAKALYKLGHALPPGLVTYLGL